MSDPQVVEGLAALPALLDQLGSRRVLVVTGGSERFLERLRPLLAGRELSVFSGARRHVPEALLQELERAFREAAPDTLLALGGGSAIGLVKALRLAQDFRFVAVPTTYSGSELTTLYGITGAGGKKTGRDARVKPDAVVYDIELTCEMPKLLTVTSLMNALAHPLSALSVGSLSGEPRSLALTAVTTLFGALEALVEAPGHRSARLDALKGAGLAARAIESGSFGRHHELAHALGGRFDLDHGGLHSVLLPHSVHELRRSLPELALELDALVGVPDLEGTLFDFLLRAGAAVSLEALGISRKQLDGLCAENPELPRELLGLAYHGRRPSAQTRFEDFGVGEPVSVRGPALEKARRVVIAVHGRGSNADSILRRAVEISGSDPELLLLAPQAPDKAWYEGRNFEARAKLGASLEIALDTLSKVLDHALAKAPAERVVLFGFSQGACLAIELFTRRAERLGGLVALSGAGIGEPGEQRAPGSGVCGTPVLLGASERDPWIGREEIERAAALLLEAGCDVTTEFVAGDAHALHARHRMLARDILRGEASRKTLAGFANAHETEALVGALPRAQNSPRKSPLGLYPEQLNGSGFVARRAENLRSWTYRIRPAAQLGAFEPLPHTSFVADFVGAASEPNLAGFAPLELPSAPTDWLDGLWTVGGAGSPSELRGYAVHVYAANRSMEERAFYDADGDLLILPQLGRLTLMTEFGVLDIEPGKLAVIPRGVRFSVLLGDSAARGYVAEVFGRHFALPERGPIGANGLADARHFLAPAAWHEDRLAPGYRVMAKVDGALYQALQDYSPYDVVAWHGNYAPYSYDLSLFSPVGNTRFDHGDPSVYGVLSAPLDDHGNSALDFIVFPPRWDATEHTFRPPYFHRNATAEFNGIVSDTSGVGLPVSPGGFFITPPMTPHGVLSRSVESALARDDASADAPRRNADGALWFQFESALPMSLSRWAKSAPNRISDWQSVWRPYRSRFKLEG